MPAKASKSVQGAGSARSTVEARAPKKGDHVFLVDGSSFVFRAYFQSMNQDRKYNYRSDGLPTGAIRLFATKLLQFVREGALGIVPTHLGIIFDKSENSFRKELYPPYKGNRSDPPEDLIPQFPLMREAVRAFGLFPVEQDRYEADDLIATYARLAVERGADVTIISADKDLMQLIKPGISMYDPASGDAKSKTYRPERRIGYEEVVAYFGVPPEKVIDVQALAGDSTDNVPGVRGIGVKTAAQLIGEYGDLETLLKRAAEIKQEKRRQALIDNAENARLSKKLVTLDDHVKLDVPIGDLAVHEPDHKRLIAFLKAMEFNVLTRRVAEFAQLDAGAIEPDAGLAGGGAQSNPAQETSPPPLRGRPTGEAGREGGYQAAREHKGRSSLTLPLRGGADAQRKPDGALTPHSLAAARLDAAHQQKFDRSKYEAVRSLERLRAFVERARDVGVVALDVETDSLDPMQAQLCGFSLAVAPNEACYVPLGHRQGGDGRRGSLFQGEIATDQIAEADALAAMKPLLEDPGVLKVGQNFKFDWQIFALRGIEIGSYDDTMLMSYVVDAGRSDHGLDPLSRRYFDHEAIDFNEVTKLGRSKTTFDNVDIAKATEYAAEDADVTLRLWRVLKARLPAERVLNVYETLERPLLRVLALMERRGISIDRQVLSRLSGEFAQEAAGLEAEINKLASEPVNVGSPKQIGDILFGKLGLPGGTRTKTGQWATGARMLEELAEQGHQLPQKILDWRQVSKLKSTYTDALPGFVNPATHRVHTNYALASTTTGRLSSSEPNLQNIPVRTEDGRKIRRAFIAGRGDKLVSADYSQIELRLLAEIAGIEQL